MAPTTGPALVHKHWNNWSTTLKAYEPKVLLLLNVRRVEFPRQNGKSNGNPGTIMRALDYGLPWIYSISKKGTTIDTFF